MRCESVARTITRIATILLAELGAVVATTGIVFAQDPAAASKPVAIRIADSTQVQVIRLRDGSSIVGRVTEISTDSVRFVGKAGTLSIARADIVELREVAQSALRSGEVWPASPNATRLLFAPT
ncbi:hypothetical protein, partial [Bradyrhizobium sp. NBAIM08]|uniref:hypothetical protein n=1 Tax=Bradyrhizobium sp. NBAIM08 TaxID=2793815 RepID=UPI001CD7E525